MQAEEESSSPIRDLLVDAFIKTVKVVFMFYVINCIICQNGYNYIIAYCPAVGNLSLLLAVEAFLILLFSILPQPLWARKTIEHILLRVYFICLVIITGFLLRLGLPDFSNGHSENYCDRNIYQWAVELVILYWVCLFTMIFDICEK
uniref:Uncharacterized protein n=1 Tax=Strigamia maritima TaxID=126957 RepID=T1ILV7_STRMM